ncbi:ubiquitin fusion degradation protein 4 [Monosporozyma unispora]
MSSNRDSQHWETRDYCGDDQDMDIHSGGEDEIPHHETNWGDFHDQHDPEDELIHEHDDYNYEDSDEDHSENDYHTEEDVDGIINRFTEDDGDSDGDEHEHFGPGMSSRDFLNTLRQHMRDNENRGDGHEVHDENGRMNLSEVLPELLSMMGSAGGSGLRNRSDASSRNARINKLVDNVENAEADPYFAMESVIELSENLLMVNQILIDRIFPMERLLNSLITILSSYKLMDEMELQMQCCRCLYNIFEVHPESISHAVDKDVIQSLQNKLAEINYIDLAEQVLETLELLSRLCGKDILHNGNLSAYIQYFDFFTIHAQRKSVAIVANACARVKKSDFNTVEELFITLKPIFLNCTDQVIVTRILGILYGVCGGLKDTEVLESLYTSDVTQHLVELISNTDTASDGRLRCLDILASVVGYSPKIAHSIVKSSDLASMFKKCLYQYSKNPNATLHETIMFVPKSLLNSISRFVALLFPPEEEQILTLENANSKFDDRAILDDFKNDENISELLKRLVPLLSEIFINTVDFGTRRNVLIGLTRIATYMNEQVAIHSVDYLVKLLGASLAQSKNILEHESNNPYEVGVLIIGLLSLVKILERKFVSVFTSPFKREGIYDLMEHINQDVLKFQENSSSKSKFTAISSNNKDDNEADSDNMEDDSGDNDDDDDEEDDYHDYLDDMDIPKEIPPKKLKFNFVNKLNGEAIVDTIIESTELILSVLDSTGDVNSNELVSLKSKVKELENMKVDLTSNEDAVTFFNAVKNCVFNGQCVLSGFELISSELPSVVANKLSSLDQNSAFYLEKTLKSVFGDKLLEFIAILQSALTRVESFSIVDSGLQGESSGMESLGKQIRIHLKFDGEDKIFSPLSAVVVSIHCIASFKVLETFIRDRAAKAKLFSWMVPREEDNPEDNDKAKTSSDVKAIKNSILKFSYQGESIDSRDTIFGALFKILKSKEGMNAKDMWDDIQIIHFSKEDAVVTYSKQDETNEENEDEEMMDVDAGEEEEILTNLYTEMKPVGDNNNESAEDILKVLKVLRSVVTSDEHFVNSKLSAKLTRQLDEPLVVAGGVLPEWILRLTKEYSFLFPFETRMFFLQCTSFGYGRFIQLWKNRLSIEKQLSSDDPLLQLGRISRSKILIARDNMLLATLRIMDDYSKSATILEFQYVDEEGTGLGPTLEFYSTVSKEFAQKKLNLWRVPNFDEENSYVTGLLFPQPMADYNQDKKKVVELFGHLGTFIARSLLDNRIVDFRFNKLFFQLAHLFANGVTALEYANLEEGLLMLKSIDDQLALSLKYIYDNRDNQPLIDDMCLTFVLPGTNIDLIDNGSKLNVHSGNATHYIRCIISFVIGEGIKDQIKSFIAGFSKVFPYSNLLILTPDELVELFGRVEEDWSTETLYSCIEANHGYTMDSMTIHNLISIMSEFTLQERRTFLQFITGSPKLPLGGFKALKPKLTVVLKQPEAGLTSDEYLASVMTCANYLKLPKYSSKEVMRQRIIQAMDEGAGAFLLS